MNCNCKRVLIDCEQCLFAHSPSICADSVERSSISPLLRAEKVDGEKVRERERVSATRDAFDVFTDENFIENQINVKTFNQFANMCVNSSVSLFKCVDLSAFNVD